MTEKKRIMEPINNTLNEEVYHKDKCINHSGCKSNQIKLIEKTLNWTYHRSNRVYICEKITILTCSKCYMNLLGFTDISSKDDYWDLWDEITNVMLNIEIGIDELISKL